MLAEYELNRERNEELFVLGGVDNVCPVHFHRKVELLYVESGEKRIFGSGKEISLGENSVYFANSYEMHGYYPSEGGRQIVVVFPNGMLKDYYDEFGSVMPAGCVVDDAEFAKISFSRTFAPSWTARRTGCWRRGIAICCSGSSCTSWARRRAHATGSRSWTRCLPT